MKYAPVTAIAALNLATTVNALYFGWTGDLGPMVVQLGFQICLTLYHVSPQVGGSSEAIEGFFLRWLLPLGCVVAAVASERYREATFSPLLWVAPALSFTACNAQVVAQWLLKDTSKASLNPLDLKKDSRLSAAQSEIARHLSDEFDLVSENVEGMENPLNRGAKLEGTGGVVGHGGAATEMTKRRLSSSIPTILQIGERDLEESADDIGRNQPVLVDSATVGEVVTAPISVCFPYCVGSSEAEVLVGEGRRGTSARPIAERFAKAARDSSRRKRSSTSATAEGNPLRIAANAAQTHQALEAPSLEWLGRDVRGLVPPNSNNSPPIHAAVLLWMFVAFVVTAAFPILNQRYDGALLFAHDKQQTPSPTFRVIVMSVISSLHYLALILSIAPAAYRHVQGSDVSRKINSFYRGRLAQLQRQPLMEHVLATRLSSVGVLTDLAVAAGHPFAVRKDGKAINVDFSATEGSVFPAVDPELYRLCETCFLYGAESAVEEYGGGRGSQQTFFHGDGSTTASTSRPPLTRTDTALPVFDIIPAPISVPGSAASSHRSQPIRRVNQWLDGNTSSIMIPGSAGGSSRPLGVMPTPVAGHPGDVELESCADDEDAVSIHLGDLQSPSSSGKHHSGHIVVKAGQVGQASAASSGAQQIHIMHSK